jgi:hypothetical protein
MLDAAMVLVPFSWFSRSRELVGLLSIPPVLGEIDSRV